MAWHVDKGLEHELTRLGMEFEYKPQLKIETVNISKSLHNNARVGDAIDQDAVDKYARSLKNGQSLPAVIIYNNIVVCGNHRLTAAHRNNLKTIAAYVITKATDKQLDLIKWTDNLKHGLGESASEIDHHIIQMHFEHGYTPTELAKRYSTPGALAETIRAESMRRKLEEEGIITDHLNKSSLLTIHTVRTTISMQAAIAKAARRYKMTVDEVNELCTIVKGIKAAKDQGKAIRDYGANIQKVRGKKPERSPFRAKFRTFLIGNKSLPKFLSTGNKGNTAFTTLTELQIKDSEKDEMVTQIDTVIAQLQTIKKNYRKTRKGKK